MGLLDRIQSQERMQNLTRRQILKLGSAAAVAELTALSLHGCGSNSGFFNQAAESYTVVVTATDTVTNAHTSANVTLTVQ